MNKPKVDDVYCTHQRTEIWEQIANLQLGERGEYQERPEISLQEGQAAGAVPWTPLDKEGGLQKQVGYATDRETVRKNQKKMLDPKDE